jgi:pyridoxine 5-phosphate synthase
MVKLGLNIDHVATLRQARRGDEPDPVWAATAAQLAGAACITVHLREDRRHVQDHDVHRLKASCQVKLNLEMAATDEMLGICCELQPNMATLVPEGRMEVTTEGGLDVAGQAQATTEAVARLHDAGVLVSAFIDPQLSQVDAAAAAGFDYCEIHTGPYAHAFAAAAGEPTDPTLVAELGKVADAGQATVERGMQFNAGHALNYLNVRPIAALANLRELHIGHAIISRSVFVGLAQAVEQMLAAMREAADSGC